MKDLGKYVEARLGKKIDFDGAYGAQCVDLFRDWCEYNGLPHTGPVKGARDLWLRYDVMPEERKHFDRIRLMKDIRPGDTAVWNKTPSNEYGHVALVISRISDTKLLVLEQDGFKQDGAKLKERPTENLLGALRIKE